MTCEACETGGGEDDPEALLDGVTNERALVLRIDIYDETNIITLRQVNSSERYQSVWQHGTNHDQSTRRRAAAIALIGEIVHSETLISSEYGPVEEVWPHSTDKRTDADGSEG